MVYLRRQSFSDFLIYYVFIFIVDYFNLNLLKYFLSIEDLADAQQEREFLEEIKMMKEIGQHKHIVSMIGCVTAGSPLCLIVEYLPGKDLLKHLREKRSKVMIYQASFGFKCLLGIKMIDCLLPNTLINHLFMIHERQCCFNSSIP